MKPKAKSNIPSYSEKVMQTIIVEYRALFLRYINDISWMYRTYKRCVASIIQQDICVPLRYLADISFLRYTAAVIYRSCDISLQQYIFLTIYRYSDIKLSFEQLFNTIILWRSESSTAVTLLLHADWMMLKNASNQDGANSVTVAPCDTKSQPASCRCWSLRKLHFSKIIWRLALGF